MLTVEEAKARRVCRICEQPISNPGAPLDWTEEFGQMVYPIKVTLNFGEEFAHTECLEAAIEGGK